MESSIQSRQLSSLEIDEVQSSSFGSARGIPLTSSWRIGMPWYGKNKHNINHGEEIPMDETHKYYGGLMKQATTSNASSTGGITSGEETSKICNHNASEKNELSSAPPCPEKARKNTRFGFGLGKAVGWNNNNNNRPKNSHSHRQQKRSRRIRGVTGLSTDDEDSVSDFQDNEWTPHDSAYGAACPVCGFIPKHIRKLIEFTIIMAMALGFVYLLVTTSIQINNDRQAAKENSGNSTSTSNNNGQLALDDDLYVEAYSNNNNQQQNGDGDDDDQVAYGGDGADADDDYYYNNMYGDIYTNDDDDDVYAAAGNNNNNYQYNNYYYNGDGRRNIRRRSRI